VVVVIFKAKSFYTL